MNEKEISELRRRFRADKSNIARVCGCCVNEKREIISRFDQSLALMGQEDAGGCWDFCASPSAVPWTGIWWYPV